MAEIVFPVGISARHVHLSQADVEKLFGAGHQLTPFKPLSQPDQYACVETVAVHGLKGGFAKVRVLGPTRRQSQVEVSRTDTFVLGLEPPVRESGDLEGTPGVRLVGPAGEVALECGLIVAQRHLHLSDEQAASIGLRDRERIKVRLGDQRAMILENVIVRIDPKFTFDLHLDTDEANAAGVKQGDPAYYVT